LKSDGFKDASRRKALADEAMIKGAVVI